MAGAQSSLCAYVCLRDAKSKVSRSHFPQCSFRSSIETVVALVSVIFLLLIICRDVDSKIHESSKSALPVGESATTL